VFGNRAATPNKTRLETKGQPEDDRSAGHPWRGRRRQKRVSTLSHAVAFGQADCSVMGDRLPKTSAAANLSIMALSRPQAWETRDPSHLALVLILGIAGGRRFPWSRKTALAGVPCAASWDQPVSTHPRSRNF